jgi:hypothetical protein
MKRVHFREKLSRCCDRVCRRASEVDTTSEILETEINLLRGPRLSSRSCTGCLQASSLEACAFSERLHTIIRINFHLLCIEIGYTQKQWTAEVL